MSDSSVLTLVARLAALDNEVRTLRQDDYRVVWQQISDALDRACPGWKTQGPTAASAAVTAILGGVTRTAIGWLAVRGPDVQPVFTETGARAFEDAGYSLYPLYAGI